MEYLKSKGLFFIGIIVGIISAIIMHIFNLTQFAPLAMICWFAITILIQLWKCDKSKQTSRQYWSINKWGVVLEVVLSNLGFWIIMVVSIYGTYSGNILR